MTMSIIYSRWGDEVSSPSSKVMPAPRPRTRGAKAEERSMMAKSGEKGGAEIIGEREAETGVKRKWAQVTCHLEGVEELQDFVKGKRMLKEEQVEGSTLRESRGNSMENLKMEEGRLSRAKWMAGEGRGKRRTRLGRARSEGEVSAAREDLDSEEVATMRKGKEVAVVQEKYSGGILRGGIEVSEDQHSRKICAGETSRKNTMKSHLVPSKVRGARSQTETSRKSLRRERPERGGGELRMERVLTTSNDASLGLRVVQIPEKGRGVVATRRITCGEPVVEYKGTLLSLTEAKVLQSEGKDPTYMFYSEIQWQSRHQKFCIDASWDSGRYGRLVNHSKLKPNCVIQVEAIEGRPRLILMAAQDIEDGEELAYNYGIKDPVYIAANSWIEKS